MKKLSKFLNEHNKEVKAGVRMGIWFFIIALIGIVIAGIPVLVGTSVGLWASLVWTVLLTILLGLSPAYASLSYLKSNPEKDPDKAFVTGGIVGSVMLFVQDLAQVVLLFVAISGVTAWNLVYGLYKGFDWSILSKFGTALLGTVLIGGLWLLGVIVFGFFLGGIVGWLVTVIKR